MPARSLCRLEKPLPFVGGAKGAAARKESKLREASRFCLVLLAGGGAGGGGGGIAAFGTAVGTVPGGMVPLTFGMAPSCVVASLQSGR